MSKYKLRDNADVNWANKEFYYDENGQAHEQYLEWGDDYTLEEGNMIDDANVIDSGMFLGDFDEFDEYQQEWN